MKNKYIIALFLVGMAVTTIGALFKIMHWPFAGAMLIVGLTSKTVAIVIYIVKILQNGDLGSFLEK